MKAELRERYERLDTDELLEIARKDLTDEARMVLHEVLRSRGVATAHASAARASALEEEEAAAAAEARLASMGARLLGFAIDVFAVGLFLYVILLPLRMVSNDLHATLHTISCILYLLLRDAIPGQSVGKRVLAIRTVQCKNGLSCTLFQSFWRNVSLGIFVMDVLTMLDRRRMRLGDMIAGTMVIRAE